MTIRERLGRLEGVRLVYLGDGNYVCQSLMVACTRLGAPRSAVWDEAENRLHAQKALLALVVG